MIFDIQLYSFYFFKVGAAVNHRVSANAENEIDDLKPTPILKTCQPPCHGSNPCIRICRLCANQPQYPNINALSLKFFDEDSGTTGKCSHISTRTAETLFPGNTNGKLLKESHIYHISLLHIQ